MPDGDVLQDMRLLLAEHTRSFRYIILSVHAAYDVNVLITNCYSFHDTLRNVLKGVCHEQSDVRLHALKALHKMLKENKVRVCGYLDHSAHNYGACSMLLLYSIVKVDLY